MRERDVEHALVAGVKKAGGLCLKFVSPGWSGAPDRLCLFPEGKACFVEVKAPGQRPRPLQEHAMGQLKKLGFMVVVLDDPKKIPALIKAMKGGDSFG